MIMIMNREDEPKGVIENVAYWVGFVYGYVTETLKDMWDFFLRG